jgi:hypothetical protein
LIKLENGKLIMVTKKKITKKKVSKKNLAKKKVFKKKTAAKNRRPHKKTAKNPKGAGAQIIIIDWDTVDKLCIIQCTGEEIASVLNIDYETLERACKREKLTKFADYIRKKKEGGKASLRRRQWKLTEAGNATMCIWLGKQYLGQKDNHDVKPDHALNIPNIHVNFVKA